MKKQILIVMLMAVCMFGCIPTTEQINTLTDSVDTLMVKVDDYQEKFAEEVDRVQENIVIVNEAVKEKADEDAVESIRVGIEASKPFNPYADEMNAALGLAVVIGGLFAKKKITDVSKKYSAHKAGTEIVKLKHPDIAAELYAEIGKARKT